MVESLQLSGLMGDVFIHAVVRTDAPAEAERQRRQTGTASRKAFIEELMIFGGSDERLSFSQPSHYANHPAGPVPALK